MTKKVQKTVSSRVYFSQLEDWEIKSYVDSLEPLHCAGGFALEGIGGKYVEKIEGCFSNVMGLSLPWLRKNLPKKENSYKKKPYLKIGFFFAQFYYLYKFSLSHGKLKPITLLKQPSIYSIYLPPIPSKANPPAQYKGSFVST